MPNKGAVRHAKVLLDGADVAWQRTDTSMSCDTVPGLHQLSAKAGFRSNQWSIECVDNGRYEVYLKADALMGGFQNEIRVAKCTASAQT